MHEKLNTLIMKMSSAQPPRLADPYMKFEIVECGPADSSETTIEPPAAAEFGEHAAACFDLTYDDSDSIHETYDDSDSIEEAYDFNNPGINGSICEDSFIEDLAGRGYRKTVLRKHAAQAKAKFLSPSRFIHQSTFSTGSGDTPRDFF